MSPERAAAAEKNFVAGKGTAAGDDGFIGKDFMLQTPIARVLYHEHAAKMPVIDFHAHLPPEEIASNKRFDNLSAIWLAGDHYKMRAMRANGVDEKFITGNAPDYEKFVKWAETLEYALMSPLYYWSHLELRRYFGIEKILSPATAKEIYDTASRQLQTADFSTQRLLQKMNVKVLCTTDDPADDLRYHKQIKEQGFSVRVVPAWRPDKALGIDAPDTYNDYLKKLSAAAQMQIRSFADLVAALKKRHAFFDTMGTRNSDHGIATFYAAEYTDSEIERLFGRLLSGESLDGEEALKVKSAILFELAVMNHDSGWVQQFHFGALRNNNTKMYAKVGPDKGFDSIGDGTVARSMQAFLDRLERSGKLAKTIFYNLNPSDSDVVVTMIGNFNGGGIPGKMQFGSAWWFADQRVGIERQLDALSNNGLLGRFVGMTTDSRSFLSYPRHEFFRRVLCNKIGMDVERGNVPADVEWLGKLVEGISYNNAREYFGF